MWSFGSSPLSHFSCHSLLLSMAEAEAEAEVMVEVLRMVVGVVGVTAEEVLAMLLQDLEATPGLMTV